METQITTAGAKEARGITPAPASTPHPACSCGSAGSECAECGKKRILVQRSSSGDAARFAPPAVHDALRSPGCPLDHASRAFFEPRLGHDFSHVRVHSDSKAAESAHAVNARAYTVGQDIVFGEGRYQPLDESGKHLIGHELVHTIQQQPAIGFAAPLEISCRGDSSERQADSIASAALRNAPAGTAEPRAITHLAGALRLQREEDRPFEDADKLQVNDKDVRKGDRPGLPAPHDTSYVEEVVGGTLESLGRMSSLTVVLLGAVWCLPCQRLKSHQLAVLNGRIKQLKANVRFRVVYVDMGAEEPKEELEKREKNRLVVEQIKANVKDPKNAIPEIVVLREHTSILSYTADALNGAEWMEEIMAAYKSAATPGVFKGMTIGASVLGALGAVGGAIGGAVLGAAGGTGAAVAGGILGGLLGGFAASAVGLGIGALIGWAASDDIGRTSLSKDRVAEVKQYLFGVQGQNGAEENGVITNKRPRRDSSADNLARDAVTLWVDNLGTKNFPLDVPARRILIQEMLDGYVSRDDERSILMILENSSDAELLVLFNGVGRTGENISPEALGTLEGSAMKRKMLDEILSIADLQDRFSGSSLKDLDAILEGLRSRFPLDPARNEEALKGRAISRSDVMQPIAADYNELRKDEAEKLAQKPPKSKYEGKDLEEIGGIFLVGDDGALLHHSKKFPGTQSEPQTVFEEAKGKFGSHRILCSYHLHPNGLAFKIHGRDAPSKTDIENTTRGNGGFAGPEHYVIDPWVVYLLAAGAGLTVLGETNKILGVVSPELPAGVRSTLEIG